MTEDMTYHFESARKDARLAARAHLRKHGFTLPNAVLGAAVDIAISTYNAYLGDHEEIGELDLGKPTDMEALAERLAKVEDRLAEVFSTIGVNTSDTTLVGRMDRLFKHFDERLTGALNDGDIDVMKIHRRITDTDNRLNDRITKVAEIIGSRIETLVLAIDEARLRSGLGNIASEYPPAVPLDSEVYPTPAFPTGGAGAAEAAAEAVLPVPQRGDRVRLEGAVADSGRAVPNGWYDVIGHSGGSDEPPSFQIEAATQFDYAKWVPWLYYDPKTLKEVRHADH